MELNEITFTEQYLYEKPEGNSFRGVSVKMNGVHLLSMVFENDTHPVSELEEKDNDFWLPNDEGRDTLTIMMDGNIPRFLYPSFTLEVEFLRKSRFLLSELEDAKLECIEIVKRYISFFVQK